MAAGAFSGMAKDARIVPVDVQAGPDHTIVRVFNLLRMIYLHALENNGFGNSVISMSFSMGFGDLAVWEEAGIKAPVLGSMNCFDTMFGWFWKKGIVTVAAAGNFEGVPGAIEARKDLAVGLPRALGGTNRPLIVVGNAGHDDERHYTSDYRDSSNSGILTLYNYGTDIKCATINSKWKTGVTGTSSAGALTAGLVAHYLSQPDLKAQFQAGGLEGFVMSMKKYVIDQAILYKGPYDDGIPRAALGDLVPCSSEEAIRGTPDEFTLNFESEDRTLRTKVVMQGMSYVMEDMVIASMPVLWSGR
ncbi:peptidase S8/S53 domain-containing protein [Aspergillus crustosus]